MVKFDRKDKLDQDGKVKDPNGISGCPWIVYKGQLRGGEGDDLVDYRTLTIGIGLTHLDVLNFKPSHLSSSRSSLLPIGVKYSL
jgi:hypothetical protein